MDSISKLEMLNIFNEECTVAIAMVTAFNKNPSKKTSTKALQAIGSMRGVQKIMLYICEGDAEYKTLIDDITKTSPYTEQKWHEMLSYQR